MLMASSPDKSLDLQARLKTSGFVCFGSVIIEASLCPKGFEGDTGKSGLLLGNAGQDMWDIFIQSPEYKDGMKDPLNRWTRRKLVALADELEARVVFPFDKPYWPFQKLAQVAAGTLPSKLGILIHPKYGLWHAFRGLLIFDSAHDFLSPIRGLGNNIQPAQHPCDVCVEKPCLQACPVGAFTGEQLLIESCFVHLDSAEEPRCIEKGCQARSACPVGAEYKYSKEQIMHHMSYYHKR